MATRPKGFGMTAELANKQAAKFNGEVATDVMTWLKNVLEHGGQSEAAGGITLPIESSDQVFNALKNGHILCKVANIISPGSVRKINESKMAFKVMENINNFLLSCEKIGVQKQDLFQTVDLYENQNIPQVISGLSAFGRKTHSVSDWTGPTFGKAEATKNVREFTEEQLNSGKNVIGLQMGSNKGATQAGQNFGKGRMIID